MHQFVQSAIDAANQGDKNKAMSFLKEVISANPNDVDAWLVLAAVVDEPQRKRQCLNRVLKLDPVNRLAREELLEMDRAEMGGAPPFAPEPFDQTQGKPAPVSTPKPQPKHTPSTLPADKPTARPTPTQARHVSLPDWAEEKPRVKPQSSSTPALEKPLVFQYSTFTRIFVYFLAVLFSCSFLLALQDVYLLLVPCGAYLLILPAVWIVSVQVEVTEKGIRASRLFGLVTSSQLDWDEIARLKSNSMQRNLELITKTGNSVKVTTQVSGYPRIVEIIRQKRPDLFSMAQSPSKQGNAFAPEYGTSPSMEYGANAAPSFSGARTFKKSFLRQYGLFLIVVPLGLVSAWAVFAEPQYRISAGLTAVVCFIFIILPFFQVSAVRVEPNKLTVESFLEQRGFSAREIREIKMQSVRGRYGRVTNFVNIVTAQGKNYPLEGFSDGDEIIYGILHQWWESYRNR